MSWSMDIGSSILNKYGKDSIKFNICEHVSDWECDTSNYNPGLHYTEPM